MIYENIKQLADDAGISIAALEREAKLANGTIGKWATVNPRIDNLQAVALVLQVSVEDLIDTEKKEVS